MAAFNFANLATWLFFFRYITAINSMINLFTVGADKEKATKCLFIVKVVGIAFLVCYTITELTMLTLGNMYYFGYGSNYNQMLKV